MIVKAAVAYADRGFNVLPLHHVKFVPDPRCSCPRKQCHSPGKHPLFAGWREAATVDRRRVRDWWSVRPAANIGLAMGGQRRLVALDIDGNAGRESLKEAGELPETWAQTTGRGEHHVFTVPDDLDLSAVRNRVSLLDAVDVRADGGYIVGAPSSHVSGARYMLLRDVDPAPLPYWLYERIIAASEAAVEQDNELRQLADDRLPHKDIRMRRATAYVAAMPAAVQGKNGSLATLKVALALVRGFCLTREQALEILVEDYNPRCAPPWSFVELSHKVDSALDSVSRVPWGYLMERRRMKNPERMDQIIDSIVGGL